MPSPSLTLLQGTVDLLILQALRRGPAHGYNVSRWIRERTDGVLATEDAALYQALHRLESKGLIASEWGVSENNRRAKYYRLTASGRRQLEQHRERWNRVSFAVASVLEGA